METAAADAWPARMHARPRYDHPPLTLRCVLPLRLLLCVLVSLRTSISSCIRSDSDDDSTMKKERTTHNSTAQRGRTAGGGEVTGGTSAYTTLCHAELCQHFSSRKKAARLVHRRAAFATHVRGLKAKLFNKTRYAEKATMKKTINMHEERDNKHKNGQNAGTMRRSGSRDGEHG